MMTRRRLPLESPDWHLCSPSFKERLLSALRVPASIAPSGMLKKQRGRITALYICHWSLLDPLCQSQALPYLRELSADGHRFALMTYEQPKYKLDQAARDIMRRQLRTQGIDWYPVNYHKRSSLFAKP